MTENIEEVKKKLAEAQIQIDELTLDWKRALADYKNLEKRVHEEKKDLVKFLTKKIFLDIIPIIDSLTDANKHLNDQGLSLIIKQFQDALVRQGIEQFDPIGKDFNPNLMECLEVVKSGDEGKVTEVLKPGYLINGELLRAAKVKVGKKEIDENTEE